MFLAPRGAGPLGWSWRTAPNDAGAVLRGRQAGDVVRALLGLGGIGFSLPGVVRVGGSQEVSKEDLEQAVPIVALILLAVFGSLAAASLPLLLGFVSVIIMGGVIYLRGPEKGLRRGSRRSV